MHKPHKLFSRNELKVSYSFLPNFKSVINGHNKNTLREQEKPSPCNCRDKTPCSSNGSYQHKNNPRYKEEPSALHWSQIAYI